MYKSTATFFEFYIKEWGTATDVNIQQAVYADLTKAFTALFGVKV